MRSAFLLVLLAFATLGLMACERDGVPPLVEVSEVSPREIEVGDRMELRGAGFPQGRTARVTFRGTLLRPGRQPMHGASIEADGVVASADRIEVVVSEPLEDRFCGHGDKAVHTTMTGDVEVAFASSAPGAPPLVGVMHGVTLDITPSSVRASVVESRAVEGAHVLSFLGVTPGVATPRGLPIEKVAPGSPGDQAGFQLGDLISAVDGVHVREVSDVTPASARSAQITLRHGDSGTEETKSVAMIGYAGERIPLEYGPALLVVGLASVNQSLGWGAQFSNPLGLTVMIAIMFGFGLSLLGVFEVTLGGDASTKLSEAAGKEGIGGAFMHGFFTTLLGTSCTAPLVGPVIGIAVNEPGPKVFALFAAIATGLSLPYFLLTWQPSWMRFLPKPGMWMVRMKQVFGFAMIGFAVWLLNSLPTSPMVVAVAAFLLVLSFAAWMYGTYHDARWPLAFGLVLIAGAWLYFIRGTVQPLESKGSNLLVDIRRGLKAGRPVFVDFTADWCQNCKFFEGTVLHTEAVQAAFKAKNVLFVKADYTAGASDIKQALTKAKRAGVPFYILFRKRGDAWTADGLTQAGLLAELNKLP